VCLCVCVQPDETVVEFTNRVKADIARQGGMVDLDWSVVDFVMPLSVCLSVSLMFAFLHFPYVNYHRGEQT